MNEGGISNVYIDKLLKDISWSFRGTYSADNIPMFFNENVSLIANLSKKTEKGTHFVAIVISKQQILYFDSFGILNTSNIIEKYLIKYNKKILFFKNQVQHSLSSHCGFFCISFILCTESKMSLQKYYKMFFKNNLFLNDYVCIEIINYFIKRTY